MDRLGFTGSVKQFFDGLKNDSKFILKTPVSSNTLIVSLICIDDGNTQIAYSFNRANSDTSTLFICFVVLCGDLSF